MDLQEYVNQFDSMTCIMSVEKNPDGSYGTMRIEVGNKAYVSSYERSSENPIDMPFGNKFVPGQEYTKYIPKDLNFEHFIYNSAVLKKPMHAYIHPDRFDVWFNIFSLPLEFNDPNKCYCTYTQEVSTEASVEQMANLSAKTTSDVLKTCIKLRSTKNFLQTMDEVIRDIRVICAANFCCIMLTDFKENKCSLLSESCDPHVDKRTLLDYLNDAFTDLVKTWMDTIGGSNCLIIKNESDMEAVRARNPRWCKSMRDAGIDSIVLFPLQYNNEVIGFIWSTNFDIKDTDHIKETLELTTFFIASEIVNYQLLQKLEMLSSTDLLTGVKNRNAMNNRVLKIVSGRERVPDAYGIVFADLNGLKTVNDGAGHNAGDQLLKNAAKALMDIFTDCEIYRAGGDEFVVIAMDKPKEDIETKIEALRQRAYDPEHPVSFAVGFYYDENHGDIRAAMREADTRMYEDKKQFYAKFPENRKR
ncbi:GGDEF domain-containing protein [Fibrobacter succinogenes]|uniref:GGDEF domain-containing protein n=1 Tax=Fibrobacter succinogenes TaxID=833 RepID=UPI00156A474C|nr:GGDEF domain-containing protein [Fibrobacter succinogenes]